MKSLLTNMKKRRPVEPPVSGRLEGRNSKKNKNKDRTGPTPAIPQFKDRRESDPTHHVGTGPCTGKKTQSEMAGVGGGSVESSG